LEVSRQGSGAYSGAVEIGAPRTKFGMNTGPDLDP